MKLYDKTNVSNSRFLNCDRGGLTKVNPPLILFLNKFSYSHRTFSDCSAADEIKFMATNISHNIVPLVFDKRSALYQIDISESTFKTLSDMADTKIDTPTMLTIQFPENITFHYQVKPVAGALNSKQFFLEFKRNEDHRPVMYKIISPISSGMRKAKIDLAKAHVETLVNRFAVAKTNVQAAIKHKIEMNYETILSTPLILTKDKFIGAFTPSHFLKRWHLKEVDTLFLFDFDNCIVSHSIVDGSLGCKPRPTEDTYQLDCFLPYFLERLGKSKEFKRVLFTNASYRESYVNHRLDIVGLRESHFDKLDCRADRQSTNKGEKLSQLLATFQEEGFTPRNIIFFDDQAAHLKEVRTVTTERNIHYIGVQTFSSLPIANIGLIDQEYYCKTNHWASEEKEEHVDKTVQVTHADELYLKTRKKRWKINELELLNSSYYGDECETLAYFMLTTGIKQKETSSSPTATPSHQSHTHNVS